MSEEMNFHKIYYCSRSCSFINFQSPPVGEKPDRACNPSIRRDIMGNRETKSTRSRSGAPNRDECFGVSTNGRVIDSSDHSAICSSLFTISRFFLYIFCYYFFVFALSHNTYFFEFVTFRVCFILLFSYYYNNFCLLHDVI